MIMTVRTGQEIWGNTTDTASSYDNYRIWEPDTTDTYEWWRLDWRMQMSCPKCGKCVECADRYCRHCGHQLYTPKYCPHCGKEI